MPSTPPYLDPSLPIPERVKDLISRLTLAEKVTQMNHPAKAIPRLGIPAYNYWSEALHGVARNGRATVFPEPIGMAATWNPDLVQRVASAIGDEGRAKYHAAVRRKGYSDWYQGLTFWSPNVNIFRDPRWGRGQETWGEDPYLTGEMGAAFVRGLQGDHPRYLKAAACAKHYAVHSGPEKDRHTFDAVPSRRDLHETYLPAFKRLVEAGVEAVMGAYNRVLGEPACASPFLLNRTLREAWGFQGHVVSDCGALGDIHKNHHVTQDAAESAALALKAGCDMGCDCVYDEIETAIARGLLSEADVDAALERTLATRFKLGMFDPPEMVPYAATPTSVIGCAAHRELAREAAVASIVLLKNQDNILPLGPEVNSLLLVGPNAANLDILLGNYYGLSEHMTTLLEGLAAVAPEGLRIDYRPGCQLRERNLNPLDWSIYAAAENDVVIACMGISPLMEGEEGDAILAADAGDRAEIELPAVQVDYLKRLAANGAKIVLVLAGGSPIALGEIADLVHAIVFIWYPGQAGGRALAEVLFGQAVPSGKLPVTFPRATADLPPFDDYSMQGRTYRFATVEPLFPFGFGLSYTRFAYSQLELERERITMGESLPVRVTLSNEGPLADDEVVQVYLSCLDAPEPAPLHKLVDFRRVNLQPGECRELLFTLTPEMMHYYDDEGRPRLEPGRFRLVIGSCSPGPRGQALGAPQAVAAEFFGN